MYLVVTDEDLNKYLGISIIDAFIDASSTGTTKVIASKMSHHCSVNTVSRVAKAHAVTTTNFPDEEANVLIPGATIPITDTGADGWMMGLDDELGRAEIAE